MRRAALVGRAIEGGKGYGGFRFCAAPFAQEACEGLAKPFGALVRIGDQNQGPVELPHDQPGYQRFRRSRQSGQSDAAWGRTVARTNLLDHLPAGRVLAEPLLDGIK